MQKAGTGQFHRRHCRLPRGAALALLCALLLAGCFPPQTDYEFGLGTTEVAGVVDLGNKDPTESDAIVVVLKNHHTFIPRSGGAAFSDDARSEFRGSITRPTAHVQRVDRAGAYYIDMPADVVSVDILFIAFNRLTMRRHFDRSVGIGRINYRAILPAMPGWRDHFYTFLEPQLQEMIVDSRYRLSRAEQKLLGDWLDAQKKLLEAGRGKS